MFLIKACQADAWRGNERRQSRDDVQGCTNAAGTWMRKSGEIQWLEDDMRRAVAVRCLQGVAEDAR